MTPTHRRVAGFSLIELITGMTVFAVLLAIGVPSFTSLIRNQRISTQANSVVGALNYARAEVAARSLPVTVCTASSAARTACGNTTNWQFGWIIFTDPAKAPLYPVTPEVTALHENSRYGRTVTLNNALRVRESCGCGLMALTRDREPARDSGPNRLRDSKQALTR